MGSDLLGTDRSVKCDRPAKTLQAGDTSPLPTPITESPTGRPRCIDRRKPQGTSAPQAL